MTQSLPPKSLVLYADDDTDDQQLIREAFEEFSSILDLVLFNNGTELYSYIQKLEPFQPKPCLIILDINMPVEDGKQTLKKLRNLNDYNEVPMVLFTTSTLPSEAAFADSYNAGFITKPLYAKQIHLILNELIEHCTDDVKEKIRKHKDR